MAQLAAARQGTHSTKSRGEVSGGGKKPYRQKGTGRARQGSIRAPQYNGGGIVHGPKPRDYDQRTPKKMKAAALRGALSDRARTGRLHVVDSIVAGDKPSTKLAIATLLELTAAPPRAVVVDRDDTVTALSLRNARQRRHPGVRPAQHVRRAAKADDLVFTQAAFDAFVAARSAEGAETVALSKAATEVVRERQGSGRRRRLPPRRPRAKKARRREGRRDRRRGTGRRGTRRQEGPPRRPARPRSRTAPAQKAPLKSGNAPKGHEVKGNEDSMKYHEPDGQWYDSTVAEVWFDSAETAEAAGFTKAGDA